MIRRLVLALLTAWRLECLILLVGVLACMAAKHLGADQRIAVSVFIAAALVLRKARHRGVLDRLVARLRSALAPTISRDSGGTQPPLPGRAEGGGPAQPGAPR
ncbi:hypothetical protein [Krasilnikovia sp. MM14-A1004]|uniref:hypothetical protein n=1 Tax=Krasilnikovia sp. MM14-A1004 TaxID=3373541 RepID=UPI00399CDCDE